MKHLLANAVTIALLAVTINAGAAPSHSVRGHVRKDGTYVQRHRSTNPDSSRRNNWSSKGNASPYTGKAGTQDPSRSKKRAAPLK
jgi:hypothetical protein